MITALTVLLVALLAWLAFYANNWFLYLVAAVVLVFFGLWWGGLSDTPMAVTLSFTAWALSAFCIYKIFDTTRSRG